MGWFLLFLVLAGSLLAVPVGVVVLWVSVARLHRRVAAIEARLADRGSSSTLVSAATPLPPLPPLPTRATVAPTASVPASAAGPVPSDMPAAAPIAAGVSAVRAVSYPRTAPVTPASTSEPAAPRADAPAPAMPSVTPSTEEWEVIVGTSWLNKIGVLVFVLGLAFLLAYSFAHVGPAGRVALGFLIGATMLGAGVVVERRPPYRTYAHGLVAGGWAALYFTTFAMHGVPAARIVENELVGTLALVAVAGAMVLHSLRYRSQTITALAYVVAYGSLAVTPLTGFSLTASVPLTASLLVVSGRLHWPGVAALGVIATYLVFAIREQLFPSPTLDPSGLTRYVLLGAYWLLFEAADIVSHRFAKREDQPPNSDAADASRAAPLPLMALNAVGFLGVTLLQIPVDDAEIMSRVVGATAAAYLAGAIVRARLLHAPFGREALSADAAARNVAAFTSVHGSIALSAGLFAWVAGLRFDGARETLALLIEAELLVLAGIRLRDVVLRRIGAGAALLVSVNAWLLATTDRVFVTSPWTMAASAPVVLLVAAAWYANDWWLRRHAGPEGFERSYSWIGLALAAIGIWRGVPAAIVGPAWAAAALALATTGTLVAASPLRWQGFVLGGLAGLVAILPRLAGASASDRDIVMAALVAAGLCGLVATVRRGLVARGGSIAADERGALVLVGSLGLALIPLIERELLTPGLVAAAWAATGLVLAAGPWSATPEARWVGTAVLAGSILQTLGDIVQPGSGSPAHVLGALSVVALLYGAGVAAGRTFKDPAGGYAQFQHAAPIAAAALLSSLLILDQLRTGLVTPAWGVQGLVLLAAGFLLRDRVVRLSGLAVLVACLLKLFGYDLSVLEPLPRIISFVVLGLVLLAVSWGYTKYRQTRGIDDERGSDTNRANGANGVGS